MARLQSFKPEFYVYRHVRLDTKQPFYVGKGKGLRAWSRQRNKHWKGVATKYGFIVQIVKSGMDEAEALTLESKLIGLYKMFGACETNYLPGGQSNAGMNNPMFGKGYKLIGAKNGMYGKPGKMRGLYGIEHPKFGRRETEEARMKKSLARLGGKHPKHKWIYITPNGTFASVTVAAKANGVTVPVVKGRCRSHNFKSWIRENGTSSVQV